ncbi:MAG: hypothetical protein ACRDIB_03595 [Ardenticatenaceae bacterium]
MWNLVLLVLDDPAKLDAVLSAWEAAGVRGATILESSGLARRKGYLQDDVPLFPSLASLIEGDRRHNATLFAIVDGQVEVQEVLARTEEVVGDLDDPLTGVFFATPLSYVKGVRDDG